MKTKLKLKYFVPLIFYGSIALYLLFTAGRMQYDRATAFITPESVALAISVFLLLPSMIVNYLLFLNKKIRKLDWVNQIGISLLCLIPSIIIVFLVL